jgi:hypothetical protein
MIRRMASIIEGDIGRPPSGRPGNIYRPSRLVVLLGLGTSAAVLGASALGVFTPLVVIGAVAAACCIGVVSYRQAGRGVVADVLAPLPGGVTGPVIIDAPRAATTTKPVTRTDAA